MCVCVYVYIYIYIYIHTHILRRPTALWNVKPEGWSGKFGGERDEAACEWFVSAP